MLNDHLSLAEEIVLTLGCFGAEITTAEFGTLVISLCAIFIAAYQAIATRKHNRLQVKPLLLVAYADQQNPTTDRTFISGISIRNIGLGPANIGDTKFKYKEEDISLQDFFEILLRETNLGGLYDRHAISMTYTLSPLENGIYLKENRAVDVVSLVFSVSSGASMPIGNFIEAHKLAVRMLRDDLRLVSTYCSVYEERPKLLDTKNAVS